jgi:hypothetical protein
MIVDINYIGTDGLTHIEHCENDEILNFVSYLQERGANSITIEDDEGDRKLDNLFDNK